MLVFGCDYIDNIWTCHNVNSIVISVENQELLEVFGKGGQHLKTVPTSQKCLEEVFQISGRSHLQTGRCFGGNMPDFGPP